MVFEVEEFAKKRLYLDRSIGTGIVTVTATVAAKSVVALILVLVMGALN